MSWHRRCHDEPSYVRRDHKSYIRGKDAVAQYWARYHLASVSDHEQHRYLPTTAQMNPTARNMTQHHELTTPSGVQEYLQTHGFPSCVSVERLSEGYSAFVFRAHLKDDTDRLYIKILSKGLLAH